MAPQNHPLKLVSSVFPILICTLNGVDQMIMEPGVSGRVPFCSSGFPKAHGGFSVYARIPVDCKNSTSIITGATYRIITR